MATVLGLMSSHNMPQQQFSHSHHRLHELLTDSIRPFLFSAECEAFGILLRLGKNGTGNRQCFGRAVRTTADWNKMHPSSIIDGRLSMENPPCSYPEKWCTTDHPLIIFSEFPPCVFFGGRFWGPFFPGFFDPGHLELLSGKFAFYKDRKSQLWLVDATVHRWMTTWHATGGWATAQKMEVEATKILGRIGI